MNSNPKANGNFLILSLDQWLFFSFSHDDAKNLMYYQSQLIEQDIRNKATLSGGGGGHGLKASVDSDEIKNKERRRKKR
jgi:hypothetical protein